MGFILCLSKFFFYNLMKTCYKKYKNPAIIKKCSHLLFVTLINKSLKFFILSC